MRPPGRARAPSVQGVRLEGAAPAAESHGLGAARPGQGWAAAGVPGGAVNTLPKSNIEYLTHHWPVVTGCSFGCPWCWAHATARRFPAVHKYPDGILADFRKPQTHPDRLDLPLRCKKPARIGVCFTGDLFGPEVSFEFELQVWARMTLAELHTFFLLTKRAQEMQESFQAWHENATTGWPLPNVWAGVSVTNQREADERIPLLLATPAARRWVSIEPILGPVDLVAPCFAGTGTLDWVVVGSINHPSAQYPAPRREWIESIVEQCRAAGVPCWVKNNVTPRLRGALSIPWPQELPA